jgi:REP element-mobilizing transposase RayT
MLVLMSIRINFAIGETYHVYNRGVEKRVIFENSHDYQRFLLLLLLANDTQTVDVHNAIRDHSIPELIALQRKPIVAIGAFSLMPNHFHMLIFELEEGGITNFMRKVATGYSMYFNVKNNRSGSLFQGRYKAKHIDTDVYLRYMYEYIHLNPVRSEFDATYQTKAQKLIAQVEKNPFTSLSAYAGNETGRLSDAVLKKDMLYDICTYEEHVASLRSWKEEANDGGRSSVNEV